MTRYVIQFMNLDTGLWNDFGFSECREDAVAQMDRHLPGSKNRVACGSAPHERDRTPLYERREFIMKKNKQRMRHVRKAAKQVRRITRKERQNAEKTVASPVLALPRPRMGNIVHL